MKLCQLILCHCLLVLDWLGARAARSPTHIDEQAPDGLDPAGSGDSAREEAPHEMIEMDVESHTSEEFLTHDDMAVYSKDVFVGKGGQAEVWTGTDLATSEKVILRFPRGFCASHFCRMSELDTDTIQESRMACTLASAAERRFQQQAAYRRLVDEASGFGECYKHLPKDDDAVAFQVWKYVKGVGLDVGFFMGAIKVGGQRKSIDIKEKRRVLRQLHILIGALTDYTEDTEYPCCCSLENPYDCSVFTSYSAWDLMALRDWRGVCPDGYEDVQVPARCGPIIHHDIKFDNVLLTVDSSSSATSSLTVAPVVIDFGASRFCREVDGGNVPYSRDWKPVWLETPWLSKDDSCHSYDVYGVGLMWLVVELLQSLPPNKLLCDVDRKQGCDADPALVGQAMIESALYPVNLLVHELRKYVLDSAALSHPKKLFKAVQHYVLKKPAHVMSTEVRGLPLVVPPEDIITETIFPMLRECPTTPGKASNEVISDISCRHRVLKRRIQEINADFTTCIEYEDICRSDRASSHVPATTKAFCLGSQTQKLWKLISSRADGELELALEGWGARDYNVCTQLLPNGETLLATAVRTCSVPIVDLLLSKCVKFMSSSELVIAAGIAGCADVLSLLFEKTALTCVKSPSYHRQLLSEAAGVGDAHMVYIILRTFRKRTNASLLALSTGYDDPDRIPIIRAARLGSADSMRFLLQAGASLQSRSSEGYTVLELAVLSGNADSIGVMHALSPNLFRSEVHTRPVLHLAVSTGKESMVRVLLSSGADPSRVEHQTKRTALHIACLQPEISLPVIRLLQDYPGALEVLDVHRRSPLSDIAQRGHVDALEELIKGQSDKAIVFHGSSNALAFAAGAGKLGCMRALLKRVPRANAWSLEPLLLSLERAQAQSMRLLVDHGFSLHDLWFTASEPLPVFVGKGDGVHHRWDSRCETIRILVEKLGSDILWTSTDNLGVNVLGRWAFDGDVEMIRCLAEIFYKRDRKPEYLGPPRYHIIMCSEPAVNFKHSQSAWSARREIWKLEGPRYANLPDMTMLGLVRARLRGDLWEMEAIMTGFRREDLRAVSLTDVNRARLKWTYRNMGRAIGPRGWKLVEEYLVKLGCKHEKAAFSV
eukprot:TRINITY_DN20998_c0_g1_i1.p1 TRINITY_DN20998_c0_g1~~TRINITY_DN20998_c0_g1_i1.p1  ORF type:complete len:1112 (-),score=85.58 TRINITY_DN20998_c0_g1_i1:174-3509(-)